MDVSGKYEKNIKNFNRQIYVNKKAHKEGSKTRKKSLDY